MIKDYISNKHAIPTLPEAELQQIKTTLINRHFAWLTALRFALREPRVWEAIYKKHNAEYKEKWFSVCEHTGDLKSKLSKYLSPEKLKLVMSKTNKAAHIIALQSYQLKQLLDQ